MPYADDDDDSPEAHERAALGAEILADAMEVNRLPTLGDLMAGITHSPGCPWLTEAARTWKRPA